jgi:hypothetical protein
MLYVEVGCRNFVSATILPRPEIMGCNAYAAESDLIDQQLPQNHVRSP